MNTAASILFSIALTLPGSDGEAAKTKAEPNVAEKSAAHPLAVLAPGQLPEDQRLGKGRNLRDAYHPWNPPKSLAEWDRRFQQVRTQLRVANGIWPTPAKTPLKPVIHGRIDRDDYTIEKVHFQSYPGHYVTGNLYRPKFRTGKLPAILSPHGHWADGRFYDAGEKGAKEQLELNAEKFEPNARYPLQARMATLARMGCVVFHYDMVGYADSRTLSHRAELNDAEAILRLQSGMGLQTWNTIRALDFLTSLEDVDTTRIGVTGASGGGTQTFILCALDDRPAVAFPAVMVSTGMQGGCTCENAPLLRVGTGNIEFAAMFAPKPNGMSGADDWTIDIETKGLPELQKLYALFRSPHNVMAHCYPNFKHNYNQVSRELMYAWMNRHLGLGVADLRERPIDPVPPKELSVFDDEHPLPEDAKSYEQLRVDWTTASQKWLESLRPKDVNTFGKFKRQLKPALEAMVVDTMPNPNQIHATKVESHPMKGYVVDEYLIGRKPATPVLPAESIPAVLFVPENWSGRTVVWIHEKGHQGLWDDTKSAPVAQVQSLLDRKIAVFSADVFLTGEFLASDAESPVLEVDKDYAGYTYCYNRTVMANRIHDVLTALGCANLLMPATTVDLIGQGDAGTWVALAKAIAGPAVKRTVADLKGFDFATVKDPASPDILPGALKYGGLLTLTSLAAPNPLYLQGANGLPTEELAQLRATYDAAGHADAITIAEEGADPQAAIDWLTAE